MTQVSATTGTAVVGPNNDQVVDTGNPYIIQIHSTDATGYLWRKLHLEANQGESKALHVDVR